MTNAAISSAWSLPWSTATSAPTPKTSISPCALTPCSPPTGGIFPPAAASISTTSFPPYKRRPRNNFRPGRHRFMATINVTVYDSTENKRVPVELPDDAPCNKIIAVLIQKLRLPTNGPDGAPLSYKFHHKNSGRQIQDTQTLADAQGRDGISLRRQPTITAARAP